LGTFGEITSDKKISRYCPFKIRATGGLLIFHMLRQSLIRIKVLQPMLQKASTVAAKKSPDREK
jgi:hypothetical protein